MAADVLKVTPEELRNTATQFKSNLQKMQTAYLQMSDAVRNLDTSWNGEASEQFKNQFEAMYKNLSQTEDKMNDAVDELTKAAGIYEQVENSNKSQMASLDVGTSPFA